MYESFFGLEEKPFNLPPDQRYLYLSPSHRESLAGLVYGIQEKKGFIVVTGEVGTGKTTLLHALLENVTTNVKTAYVFYSRLRFHDFLQYILDDFGVQTAPATTAEYQIQLNQFLLEQHENGASAVVVIDEAQNLPITLLEDIRMLSNLEFAGEKLLQIVLVGQPALHSKLRHPRLRQLHQRISIACEVLPLSGAETQAYIQHRFTMAGGDAEAVFHPRVFKVIHTYTGGIPRLIHTVCDNALLNGYAEGKLRLTPGLIREVVRDLDLPSQPRSLAAPLLKTAAVLAVLVLLGMALYVVGGTSVAALSWSQVHTVPQRWYRTAKAQARSLLTSVSELRNSHEEDQTPSEPVAERQHGGRKLSLTGTPGSSSLNRVSGPENRLEKEEMQAIVDHSP